MKRADPIQGIRCKLRTQLKKDGLVGKFQTDLVKSPVNGKFLSVSHSDESFVPKTFVFDGINVTYFVIQSTHQ